MAMRSLLGALLWVATAVPGGAVAACDVPIAYAVGEVSPRFDVSRAEVRRAVREAARMWEAAAGRELFDHRPGAGFRIKLEYGELQQATERIQGLEADVDSLRERIEAREQRLDAAKARFERERAALEQAAERYRADKQGFEERVRELQREGGAGAGEREALRQRRQALNERAEALRARQAELQQLEDRINRLAVRTNALVLRHNKQVRERDRIARPGREFRQGYYQRSGTGGEQITIRQFRDMARLRYALAHELGHALGLGHVDDPEAVMNYLNRHQDRARLSLTAADRKALRAACGR